MTTDYSDILKHLKEMTQTLLQAIKTLYPNRIAFKVQEFLSCTNGLFSQHQRWSSDLSLSFFFFSKRKLLRLSVLKQWRSSGLHCRYTCETCQNWTSTGCFKNSISTENSLEVHSETTLKIWSTTNQSIRNSFGFLWKSFVSVFWIAARTFVMLFLKQFWRLWLCVVD